MGNMQAQQEQMQAELEKITVSADAGDGAIKVDATANRVITNISIDPEKLDLNDHEELEDLLLTAINRVLERAQAEEAKHAQEMISKMMPGLGGMFGQ